MSHHSSRRGCLCHLRVPCQVWLCNSTDGLVRVVICVKRRSCEELPQWPAVQSVYGNTESPPGNAQVLTWQLKAVTNRALALLV